MIVGTSNQGTILLIGHMPHTPDKPKLAILINEDWFFVSHFLARAKAAQREGFDVTIIARTNGDSAIAEKMKGLSVVDFNMRRTNANPFKLFLEVMRLRAIYRQLEPDIAHHVGLRPMVVGSLAAIGNRVLSIINAPIGLGFIFLSNTVRASLIRQPLRMLLRFAVRRPNAMLIVENSDDLTEMTTRYDLPRARVRLIEGAGVDFSKFQGIDHLKTQEGAEPAPPTIMLASRMLREKGVQEFVEASRIIRAAGIPGRFVLVGEPDMENPGHITEDELRAWHEEGIVEWWGHSSRMTETLQEADIFVLPSYREGLPKVVLEAIASGCAIITTDVPGCRQAVTDGETGLLVPAHDGTMLAKAISDLIHDAEKRRRLATAAYADAQTRFAEDVVIAKTVNTYREVLSSHQRGS